MVENNLLRSEVAALLYLTPPMDMRKSLGNGSYYWRHRCRHSLTLHNINICHGLSYPQSKLHPHTILVQLSASINMDTTQRRNISTPVTLNVEDNYTKVNAP